MTINKNQKEIVTALAGITTAHAEMATKQLNIPGVDKDILNKQLELSMQNTEMLQAALAALLGSPAPVAAPAPVVPATPAPPVFKVTETSSQIPLYAEPAVAPEVTGGFTSPLKADAAPLNMTLRIAKPCESCPFASTCNEKKSPDFINNCGIDAMKETMLASGTIEMEVVFDDTTSRVSYIAYKNRQYIGHLVLNKETKDLVAVLEEYMGYRVFLSTSVENKRLQPKSIFSMANVQVIGHEPLSSSPEQKETFSSEDLVVEHLFSI